MWSKTVHCQLVTGWCSNSFWIPNTSDTKLPTATLHVFISLFFFFIMIKYIKFHVDSRAKLLRTDKIYPSPVHDTLFRSSSLYVPYFVVLEAFFLEILKRLSQSLFVQIFKYMVIWNRYSLNIENPSVFTFSHVYVGIP